MEFEIILLEAETHMEDAIKTLERQAIKINVGTANPRLIAPLKVKYYETLTPIRELATITVPAANQIMVTPYDRKVLKGIVHAIAADQALGLTPHLEGDKVRIIIPALTLETRQRFVKRMKEYVEHAKVLVRKARQNANKKVEGLKKDLSKDLIIEQKNDIQELTEKFIKQIDTIFSKKEKEIIDL